jgi:hypothetical protein
VQAAQELPTARAALDQLVARAEADAELRGRILADLEAAFAAEGIDPQLRSPRRAPHAALRRVVSIEGCPSSPPGACRTTRRRTSRLGTDCRPKSPASGPGATRPEGRPRLHPRQRGRCVPSEGRARRERRRRLEGRGRRQRSSPKTSRGTSAATVPPVPGSSLAGPRGGDPQRPGARPRFTGGGNILLAGSATRSSRASTSST